MTLDKILWDMNAATGVNSDDAALVQEATEAITAELKAAIQESKTVDELTASLEERLGIELK